MLLKDLRSFPLVFFKMKHVLPLVIPLFLCFWCLRVETRVTHSRFSRSQGCFCGTFCLSKIHQGKEKCGGAIICMHMLLYSRLYMFLYVCCSWLFSWCRSYSPHTFEGFFWGRIICQSSQVSWHVGGSSSSSSNSDSLPVSQIITFLNIIVFKASSSSVKWVSS